MGKRAPRYESADTLTIAALTRHAQGWVLDCDVRQLSKRTVDTRQDLVDKLLWFLRHHHHEECGTEEIRAFLHHVSTGHLTREGRWGNPANRQPVRPTTVRTYHTNLETLFNHLVHEQVLEESPMERMKRPIARADQIVPFTAAQVEALIRAAQRTHNGRRDEALVRFLVDTGTRASEVCGLQVQHVDLTSRRCTVLGKGNKSRSIPLGRQSTKSLWAYLKDLPREPEEPLFVAERGQASGEPLTRSGLLQLIERLGNAAGVEAVRCSPHTFRHTFAVMFLRNGGNIYALMELLGHTSLTMSQRYLKLAQADIENQHRQFSPGDRLSRRRSA